MDKTIVAVLVSPDAEEAAPFRAVIEANPRLRERVDLRFSAGDAAAHAIREAEVVVCGKLPPELLGEAVRVRWISFWFAGLDNQLTAEMHTRQLLITNASGVHGPGIAEQVFAYMLMFTRRMPKYFQAQQARRWAHDDDPSFDELIGKTLGIAGFGRIGEALAVRARSFGMRIVATKHDISRRHDPSAPIDRLFAPSELPAMVAESDHLCIALPYTPRTHHLFDAQMLSHLKPTAFLYNISRGRVVDEAALVSALRERRLRGAGLDVFETEPLPEDSPLWTMENVLITPHVAGFTPHYFARTARLFAENLERYLAGAALKNLYDRNRGY